jgi:hypothetical protein
LDLCSFIHDYSILDDLVTKKGWIFYRKKLSDNFTQVEVAGTVALKNMWKFKGLEVWHHCCFIYVSEGEKS